MKNINSNHIQYIRLFLGAVAVVLIFLIFDSQNAVLTRPEDRVISSRELLLKNSPILGPAFIRQEMLPSVVRFKDGRWARLYYSRPSSFIMTYLYYRLSEITPGKPRFPYEESLSPAIQSFLDSTDSGERAKFLNYLGVLHDITGIDTYKDLFLEHFDLLREQLLNEETPDISLYKLRTLAYYSLFNKDEEDSSGLLSFYDGYTKKKGKKFAGKKDNSLSKCSFLWAISPGLKKIRADSGSYPAFAETILNECISLSAVASLREEKLSQVLRLLDSVVDLSAYTPEEVEKIFGKIYQNHIRHVFNYPGRSECPPAGGFFEKRILSEGCRNLDMILDDNILLNTVLYKISAMATSYK